MNFEEAMKEMEGVVINLNELPFTAFEVWFEDQDFYTNMRFIHGDKLFDKDGGAYRVLPVQMTYLAWLVGRAGIKEMDQVIKMQDADLRKYEKQIESLKAQLNNMEACYIGKKKQVEACVALAGEWRGKPMGGWSDYARGGLHSRQDCTDDLEKALRGAND